MLFVPDEDIKAKKRRCIAHPVKKRGMLERNEATDYTARAFAILTYYKLCDDISDEKMLRRMATSILRPVFATAKNKAKLERLSAVAHEKLSAINRLEAERCPSVDKPAALFGELLGEIFCFDLDGENALITKTLGFHLGKFIYAADAAEDYDKDRTSVSYNPYVLLYDGIDLTPENKDSIKCALIMECRGIEEAVNLLPFGNRAIIENIINNIIYLGLPKRISFLDKKEECSERKEAL
jgi:hypothetical protein